MFKMRLLIFCATVVACVAIAESLVYEYGHCPMIKPMYGFDINKFLGVWYGVQTTPTSIKCNTYNYTRSQYPDEYISTKISETFDHGEMFRMACKRHEVFKFLIPNRHVPGHMVFSFPRIVRRLSHIVFATDYVNYAAIFNCQPAVVDQHLDPHHHRTLLVHISSVTILSRRKTLDRVYLNYLSQRLSYLGIDTYDLVHFDLKDCFGGKNNEVDIDLNINSTTTIPETFYTTSNPLIPDEVTDVVTEEVTNETTDNKLDDESLAALAGIAAALA